MMTKKTSWVIFMIMAAGLLAQEPRVGFEGKWKTIDDKTGQVRSIVRLERQGDELRGYIEQIFPAPGEPENPVCEKGPERFLGKPVLGMNFMWGFRFKGDRLTDGEVFDPESGKTYRCSLELLDGGRKMKLFGYIKMIFKVGRSQIWERLEPDDTQRTFLTRTGDYTTIIEVAGG
jgi:uncharacterized protein (DUF2147 family)